MGHCQFYLLLLHIDSSLYDAPNLGKHTEELIQTPKSITALRVIREQLTINMPDIEKFGNEANQQATHIGIKLCDLRQQIKIGFPVIAKDIVYLMKNLETMMKSGKL